MKELKDNEMEELICELDKEKINQMTEEEIIEGFKTLYQTDEVERISNDPIYLIKIPRENDLWRIIEKKEGFLKEDLDSAFDKFPLDEKATFVRENQKPPEKNKSFSIQKLGVNEKPRDDQNEPESWEKKQIKYDLDELLPNVQFEAKRIPIGIVTIDTGINPDHPAFGDVVWRAEENLEIMVKGVSVKFPQGSFGFDIFNVDKEEERGFPIDEDNHGTSVAGIIGAKDVGVARFNEGNFPVQLLAVKAFDSQSSLEGTETILMALDFIIEAREALRNAKNPLDLSVVNMSFGYFRRDNVNFSKTLEEKIKGMADDGIIFICASGNNGKDVDGDGDDLDWAHFPSSIDSEGVISVAATTSEGVLWTFSNFGKKGVLIAAPGENVFTTRAVGENSFFSGTSLAAPFVSASAALLLLMDPQLEKGKVKEILLNNANTIPELVVRSEGKLDISSSISNI